MKDILTVTSSIWHDITRHWEWLPLKSCPSLEDFVTYNGLQPARPTWFAPHQRTLSCTTDFDPLGQHVLPLIGGLCHVQQTSPRWANMICPSSEDFVRYNRLQPAGPAWCAPHRRTLSRTTDFDPLGLNDLLLIGGLCLVQWTLTRWVSMITQQDRSSTNKPMTHWEWHQEWRKTSIQRPTTTSSPRIRSPHSSKMKLI
jgi:hypothetical protein